MAVSIGTDIGGGSYWYLGLPTDAGTWDENALFDDHPASAILLRTLARNANYLVAAQCMKEANIVWYPGETGSHHRPPIFDGVVNGGFNRRNGALMPSLKIPWRTSSQANNLSVRLYYQIQDAANPVYVAFGTKTQAQFFGVTQNYPYYSQASSAALAWTDAVNVRVNSGDDDEFLAIYIQPAGFGSGSQLPDPAEPCDTTNSEDTILEAVGGGDTTCNWDFTDVEVSANLVADVSKGELDNDWILCFKDAANNIIETVGVCRFSDTPSLGNPFSFKVYSITPNPAATKARIEATAASGNVTQWVCYPRNYLKIAGIYIRETN